MAGRPRRSARVGERFTQGALNERALGHAAYRQAEVYRLQGDFGAAEAAFREASRFGLEPQPGLALLRLSQGNGNVAAAAIRRALSETTPPLKRAALLPAYVEVMLAVGEIDGARTASTELEELAERQGSDVLDAMSAHARGAVDLAGGDPDAALVALRRAWHAWQDLEAPYEAARTRVLAGLACRALGDEDTALLELEAARGVFAHLEARAGPRRPRLARRRAARGATHGLTARELKCFAWSPPGRATTQSPSTSFLSDHTVHDTSRTSSAR